MSYTIESMAVELSDLVPAAGTYPTATDYEAFCFNALVDFNLRCPKTNEFLLTLTDAVVYSVPTDVQYFINLLPSVFGFYRHDRVTNEIIFTNEPLLEGEFTVRYAGGVVFNRDDATDVLDIDSQQYTIILAGATANALNGLAGNVAKNAFSYTLGTQSIDRRVQADSYFGQSKTARQSYLEACMLYNRRMII